MENPPRKRERCGRGEVIYMTERIDLDYSKLPIADPYVGIAQERRLKVLSSSPSMHNLFMAEKVRNDRIQANQEAPGLEQERLRARIAKMDERRQAAQGEVAA